MKRRLPKDLEDISFQASSMAHICVIPARSGSRGIKDKNLQMVGGRSLLERAVDCALEASCFEKIVISSDSSEYLDSIGDNGLLKKSKRPEYLSADDIHSSEVVRWELENVGIGIFSTVTMLLPTSPFRKAASVRRAVEMVEPGIVDSVVGVLDTGKYINNLRCRNKAGYIEMVSSEVDKHHQRQGLRSLLQVTGSIFVASTEVFMEQRSFHVGRAVGLEVGLIESIDINSWADLETARKLDGYI